MSEFIQIVRMAGDVDFDAMSKMSDDYRAAVAGRATYTSEVLGRDLDTGDYLVIVTFPSKEAADENNNLPETAAMAEKMGAMVTAPPSFTNIEVLDRRP